MPRFRRNIVFAFSFVAYIVWMFSPFIGLDSKKLSNDGKNSVVISLAKGPILEHSINDHASVERQTRKSDSIVSFLNGSHTAGLGILHFLMPSIEHKNKNRRHGNKTENKFKQSIKCVLHCDHTNVSLRQANQTHAKSLNKTNLSGDGKVRVNHNEIKIQNGHHINIGASGATTGNARKWCPGAAGLTMFDVPLERTALASFPGSGNSWVRDMLQQISGKLTGSTYYDASLAVQGFPGEQVCFDNPRKCLIEKTHEYSENTMSLYAKAVVLIRNPYDAILSYFHFHSGSGHVGQQEPSAFKSQKWTMFVQKTANNWLEFYCAWTTAYRGKLYLLIYENLRKEIITEMEKLSKFLNIPFQKEQRDCLESFPVNPVIKRKHVFKFSRTDLYPCDLSEIINKCIQNLTLCMREKFDSKTEVIMTYLK